MSQGKIILLVILAAAALIGGLVYLDRASDPKLEGLAQCIKDSGATFFGTFWCPHCNNQKKMFGNAASLLPYVECSTPDRKAQTEICKEKKVESYPTWEFKDGSRQSGVLTPEQLANFTSCPLPESQ